MSAIGKGDWVQVIIASGDFQQFKVGDVFCVEEVSTEPMDEACRCGKLDCAGLQFFNVPPPHGPRHLFNGWWASCAVKPLGGNALTRTREAPADLVDA